MKAKTFRLAVLLMTASAVAWGENPVAAPAQQAAANGIDPQAAQPGQQQPVQQIVEAPPVAKKPKTKLERMMAANPVFGTAITSEFPLSPSEIGEFKKRKYKVERANVDVTTRRPPRSKQSTLIAEPDHTLGLRLAKGFGTTIRLTDASGVPLRILGHTPGSEIVTINTVPEKPSEKGALALTIIPNDYGATNLTIYPEKGERPLVIDLTVGSASEKTVVNYQSDIRLSWVYSPSAYTGGRYTSPLSDDLLSALREQPEPGWRSMRTTNNLVAAWKNPDGQIYIKCRNGAKILSPHNFVRDAVDDNDRSSVYLFQSSVSALVIAHAGRPVPVRVGE